MAARKKKSARASVRADAPRDLWKAKAPALHFGREEFRFRLERKARRLGALNIDPWVDSCNWERQGAVRTAELNFHRPLGPNTATLIANGDEVVCYVAIFGAAGGWRRLWKMRVATPSHQIYAGIMALALATDLGALTKSKVAWKFRKGKAKPHGWNAKEVTLAVCRRFNIDVGHLPEATYRFDKLVEKSLSPYDVIVRAWKMERLHTGRRFDIDMSTGALNITELREPRYMLRLGAAIAEATMAQSFDGIASAVVATATHKAKGEKKATKLRVKIVDADRRRRYGYIVKTITAPHGISSRAELRAWAKKRLARLYRAKKTVTFTHPGLPFVDRGDALRLYLPEAEFNQIVFVTNARHNVSAGSYTMDVSIGFDDPWRVDQRKARIQRKKAAAAARRRRERGAHATRTPKRARTRSNA